MGFCEEMLESIGNVHPGEDNLQCDLIPAFPNQKGTYIKDGGTIYKSLE